MDFERKKFESVYSNKVKAGRRRTYFFDVRKTKGNDFYITITESTKRFAGDGYERHKIFLYKEDFNRFENGLVETIKHIKTELMPDYDYDEFDRRHAEYEERKRLEAEQGIEPSYNRPAKDDSPNFNRKDDDSDKDDDSFDDDDLKW